MMQSRIEMDDLLARAADLGLADTEQLVDVVRQLVAANVVARNARPRRGRSMSIRVHGRGPLSDVVVSALRCSARGAAHQQRGATGADVDLVVLTDFLVVDPALVRERHAASTPHLLVRVRDGTGLVGPIPRVRHMCCGYFT